MKHLLATTLCLLPAVAMAQVDFGAVCTPKQRCDALRAAYDAAKPGDTLTLPAGVYADTKFPKCPTGVRVVGAGRGKTVLQSPDYYADEAPCCFGLNDGSTYESLTLQAIGPKNRQTIVVGFNTTETKPRSATLKDIEVLDGCWGGYNWLQTGNRLRFENCFIRAARVGIAAGASNGATAQFFDIINTRILLDASLNTQGGSVTHPVWAGQVGVLARGGLTKISGLDVEAYGPPPGTGPRVVAVTDLLDLDSSSWTVMEVSGLRTRLSLGGVTEKWDIDVRYGTLRLGGSYGSGGNGKLLICPSEKLPK